MAARSATSETDNDLAALGLCLPWTLPTVRQFKTSWDFYITLLGDSAYASREVWESEPGIGHEPAGSSLSVVDDASALSSWRSSREIFDELRQLSPAQPLAHRAPRQGRLELRADEAGPRAGLVRRRTPLDRGIRRVLAHPSGRRRRSGSEPQRGKSRCEIIGRQAAD